MHKNINKIAKRIETVINTLHTKNVMSVITKLRTAVSLLKASQRRFLNFNQTQGVETESYMTQPGYGHPLSTNPVFLDNTGQGVNVDIATEFWNKSDNTRHDYPIGENNEPTGYHGPHNNKEQRRMPIQTIDNLKPPRVVPR